MSEIITATMIYKKVTDSYNSKSIYLFDGKPSDYVLSFLNKENQLINEDGDHIATFATHNTHQGDRFSISIYKQRAFKTELRTWIV